jgi:hypothetical protein
MPADWFCKSEIGQHTAKLFQVPILCKYGLRHHLQVGIPLNQVIFDTQPLLSHSLNLINIK